MGIIAPLTAVIAAGFARSCRGIERGAAGKPAAYRFRLRRHPDYFAARARRQAIGPSADRGAGSQRQHLLRPGQRFRPSGHRRRTGLAVSGRHSVSGLAGPQGVPVAAPVDGDRGHVRVGYSDYGVTHAPAREQIVEQVGAQYDSVSRFNRLRGARRCVWQN